VDVTDEVKWPAGYAEFYHSIRLHRERILTGTVIAIDPSSGGTSQPGFAIYKAGEIVTSGDLDLPSKRPIYERLQLLHERVMKLTPEPPDVFVIEQIRGQRFSHHFLLFSIGATIAAARTPRVIEIPLNVWRALAKATPGYIKADCMDAELQGKSIIMLAQKFAPK